jgi:hypothetical protein
LLLKKPDFQPIKFVVREFAPRHCRRYVPGLLSMNRSIALLVVALAASQHFRAAHAATEVFAYVINPIGGYVESKTASVGPLSLAKSGGDDRGSGASRAVAEFGVLRAFAEAHAVNTGSAFQALSAGAQASFRDDLTINAPGLDGANGTLKVQFALHGSVTCSGGGDSSRASYADCHFEFRKDGSILQEEYFLMYYDGVTEGNNFLGQTRTVTVPFKFGIPFELKLFIETAARAYNYRGADAVGDLEHTATWGGFLSITDADGNEINNYSATSGSGANFVEPILPPAPKLIVRRTTDSELELTWTTQFSDYQLYSASALPATSWTPVEIPTTTVGSEIKVTLPTNDSRRFFVLKKM